MVVVVAGGQTEVATMKMCKHENVLPCHCCFSDDATLWVVMPYMDRGASRCACAPTCGAANACC